MELATEFDAVVMLTMSDWKSEPRSNRYHYASRFAHTLPVLFFQNCSLRRGGIDVEPSEIEGLDLVTVSRDLTSQDAEEIIQLLDARGIRRPLVWIYDSLNYLALIDLLPKALKAFHATEDYFTETKGWTIASRLVAESITKLSPSIDLMVFVSPGIVDSYCQQGGYRGPVAVIKNGCDAEYFIDRTEAYALPESKVRRPVAIFQGGINKRLDYELTLELIERMPDWEFRFCGAALDSPGWERILAQPNVRFYGVLPPEEFTRHMCEATVGIIPFIQDQWIRNSLPLKAYEYVACGLPVVTVPITALEGEPELMVAATTVREFEVAMRRAGGTRHDPALMQKRRQIAMQNSYNTRFATMAQRLVEVKRALVHSQKKLNIAILYDNMFSMHVSTIREHLEAFDKFSSHTVNYIPATPEFWNKTSEEVLGMVDFSIFDAVFIHYSTRMSILSHFDQGLALALEKYNGLKVLFIQDEYEGTETARSWMERLKFDIVYTCVPQDGLEQVYPAYRFPTTEFLPTLTGYVPEDPALETYSRPLAERKLLIAYRGRKLPAVYGELGYEKYRIGVEMKAIAAQRNLMVDIEVDDSKRIYGSDWYKFLGSARATLGTESGSNVFDFDGLLSKKIDRLEKQNPNITFDEISVKVLSAHEGLVRMNQISPKIFEAICLRTALVLFEGSYSGVVRPNEHYIPLKKDFSNINEVLEKLENDTYLQQLTERAYRDIVASGKFSYQSFVRGVDTDIERRLLRSINAKLMLGPILFIARDGSLKQALPVLPFGLTAGPHPMGYPRSFEQIAPVNRYELVRFVTVIYSASRRILIRLLPVSVKVKLKSLARSTREQLSIGNLKKIRIVYKVWHLLPAFVRSLIVKLLERSYKND